MRPRHSKLLLIALCLLLVGGLILSGGAHHALHKSDASGAACDACLLASVAPSIEALNCGPALRAEWSPPKLGNDWIPNAAPARCDARGPPRRI